MPRSRSAALFKIRLAKADDDPSTDFIGNIGRRILACVDELLLLAGYRLKLGATFSQSRDYDYVTIVVKRTFVDQIDLFAADHTAPTLADIENQVVRAATAAVAQFRMQTTGVLASDLEETLKKLRVADARIISILSKMPKRAMTIERQGGPFVLNVQTSSNKSLSWEERDLVCLIEAVGERALYVRPVHRNSHVKVCLHTVRVNIPASKACARYNKHEALDQYPDTRLVLLRVKPELVERQRRFQIFELCAWPPVDMTPSKLISNDPQPAHSSSQ